MFIKENIFSAGFCSWSPEFLRVEKRNENILDRNDGCYFRLGNPHHWGNLRFGENRFFLSGEYELHFLKDLS